MPSVIRCIRFFVSKLQNCNLPTNVSKDFVYDCECSSEQLVLCCTGVSADFSSSTDGTNDDTQTSFMSFSDQESTFDTDVSKDSFDTNFYSFETEYYSFT